MKSLDKRVLYVVGTGAKKMKHIPRMIEELVGEGAEVYTMMSDMGRKICDSSLSEFKMPGNTIVSGYSREGEVLPVEDMVLVAPCTFNTLNKGEYQVELGENETLYAPYSVKLKEEFLPVTGSELLLRSITGEEAKQESELSLLDGNLIEITDFPYHLNQAQFQNTVLYLYQFEC